MKTNQYSEQIFSEEDVCDLIMSGRDPGSLNGLIVEQQVDLETVAAILDDVPKFIKYDKLAQETVEQFDHRCQNTWFMPPGYKNLDIAEYVLGLCNDSAELQRVGEELLLFQERGMFDLLRYLKYLVDLAEHHRLILGVGRGSSVASYVLYKLGVHKIDSLYYDLDPREFLR